jgi:transcriptional regulator GlxA family with amidase domain
VSSTTGAVRLSDERRFAAAAWHVNRGSTVDPSKLSLTGICVGQAVTAVLAVLAVSEEYGTGMIRTTLTAMPRRASLLARQGRHLGRGHRPGRPIAYLRQMRVERMARLLSSTDLSIAETAG